MTNKSMKTNDKLPKENDYSLAYSSYNTQDEDIEQSKRKLLLLLLLSNCESKE